MLKTNSTTGLTRSDGSARTAPAGERNDWSRKAQTKAVRSAFKQYGSTRSSTLVVSGRTFGIR